MPNHEDSFRELYGMKIPEEKKQDFSSKETWAKMKENLVQEMKKKQEH